MRRGQEGVVVGWYGKGELVAGRDESWRVRAELQEPCRKKTEVPRLGRLAAVAAERQACVSLGGHMYFSARLDWEVLLAFSWQQRARPSTRRRTVSTSRQLNGGVAPRTSLLARCERPERSLLREDLGTRVVFRT